MRKLLLFTSLLIVTLLSSCSKDENIEKFCWKFTIKQTTSISPSTSGYPQTITTTSTQCDLTESQAEEVVKKLTSKTTTSGGGYKITVTTKVTKQKTDNI